MVGLKVYSGDAKVMKGGKLGLKAALVVMESSSFLESGSRKGGRR